MAGKKKNDFWDDVDILDSVDQTSGTNHAEAAVIEEDWSAVKSVPLKIIMRLLLMVSCLVALTSAYIAYEYVGDRYAGGSYSSDFYNSGSFAEEYNKSMSKLLQLVQDIEADPLIENEEMLALKITNVMGQCANSNFSFMILDSDSYKIASSGDDAKDRIESSSHYVVVSNTEGQMTVQSSIPGTLLEKEAWSKVLSETSNKYTIYSSVDNELIQKDGFYEASQTFNKMESYFNIAKFVGIAAAVIFIICLIFCIISTGMKRGYSTVQLSWFDRIFTEIALIVMIGITGVLIYALRKLTGMDGAIYQYANLGVILLLYIWVIRSYFSIVRRIKAGRLIRSSLIGSVVGGIAGGIDKLPSPVNVIVGGLLLIVINGGLVAGVIYMRQYTVRNIPIMFIVAPIVFVIELLALLMRGGGADEDEEDTDIETENESVDVKSAESTASDEEDDVKVAAPIQHREPVSEIASSESTESEQMDWEALDLGKAVEEAERKRAVQNKQETERKPIEETFVAEKPGRADSKMALGHTEIIAVEDVENAIREAGLTPQIDGMPTIADQVQETETAQVEEVQNPASEGSDSAVEEIAEPVSVEPVEVEDAGRENFVQLNKDVRKMFKPRLSKRGISVTVRAPEKPVIIDIDRSSLGIIISDIFTQIERLSAKDTRNYVEVYRQGGKIVYVVKILVAEDKKAEAEAAVRGDDSFDNAKKIIEGNDGRFVAALEGTTLKVGMLIDAVE